MIIAMEPKVYAKERLEERRPDQCCAPIGDIRGSDWSYCPALRSNRMKSGRRVAYCEKHFALFFVPAKPIAVKALVKLNEAA